MPLATAFRERGDDVAVATAASFAPRVEASGLRALPAGLDQDTLGELFAPHRAEIATLPIPARREQVFSRRFALLDAPARVDELRREAEAWQPDLIVHETSELAGPLVAAGLGIPSAQHSFGRMVPWAAIDAAAAVVAPMWEDAGVEAAPHAGMFRGPYIDLCPPGLAWEHPPDGTPVLPLRPLERSPHEPTERPLLYVTLGTVVNDVSIYRMLLQGLSTVDADVLLTTGHQNDPAELGPIPANATVERYVPQAEVLPRCALVVTHGGSGSMLGALAHGVPMLVVPRQADQFENAAALAKAGAATVLFPNELTADAVHEQVETLLREPHYREVAHELADEIASMPSADDVAQELTRSVAS